MTPSSKEPDLALAGLALLLIFGFMIWRDQPIKSDRLVDPTHKEIQDRKIKDDSYESWPWEDPFGFDAASYPFYLSRDQYHFELDEDKDIENFTKKIITHSNPSKNNAKSKSIDLLVVWVDVQPDSLDHKERRIRQRYAVMSGLTESGYLPSEPNRIHFYTSKKFDIRWEYYQHSQIPKDRNPDKVVIWIDKRAKYKESCISSNNHYSFSQKLKNLKAKDSSKNNDSIFSNIYEIDITTSSYLIHLNDINSNKNKEYNTNELVNNLAFEILDQRRIKKPTEIAIIAQYNTERVAESNWDNTENLTSQFRASFCSLVENDKEGKEAKDCEGRIKNIPYLKGLDAYQQAIDKEDQNKDGQIAKKWGDRLSIIDRHNPPIGSARFDYLHRLAIEIKNTHKELDPSKRIKAVGVFGNDFYDKLLIFQALRKEMPNIVLFTTDLDAQMFYPEHWRWTRNLIVASHFDLKLGEEHQIQSPPFRDSQQTAIYYATRIATGDDSKLIGKEAPPLLFEIGRNGPVHLFLPEKNHSNSNTKSLQSTTPNQSVHPDYNNQTQLKSIFFSSILITFILIFLVYEIRPNSGVLVLWLIITALAFYYFWNIALNENNAPLSLTDGTSLWPTIFIRIIACALAILFFVKSVSSLNKNFNILEKIYSEIRNSTNHEKSKKLHSSFAILFILMSSWLYWIYAAPTSGDIGLFFYLAFLISLLFLPLYISSSENHSSDNKKSLSNNFIFIIVLVGAVMLSFVVLGGLNKISYFNEGKEIIVWFYLLLTLILFYIYTIADPSFRSIKAWREENSSENDNFFNCVRNIWDGYHACGRLEQRALRLTGMWLFFVTSAVILDSLLPILVPVWPSPCRGISCDWDFRVQTISFIAIMLLIIFVLDALRLCFYWIQKLHTTLSSHDEKSLFLLETIIIMVAKRTQEVDKLIYYPLIAIMLILFARINYFDNLDFPLSIGITFATSITLLIFAGFKLRSEAEQLRTVVIERAEQLVDANTTIQKIRSINYGAFYPMLEQPVMRALLLILASLGLFASEYIMVFG